MIDHQQNHCIPSATVQLIIQALNAHPHLTIFECIYYNPIHGRNLVGDTDVSPPLFQTEGGHKMPCPPTFFSIGFVFGEVPKIKVMFVTSCVKLNVRSHTAKLMLTLETMGVGRGGARRGLAFLVLEIISKKGCFFNFEGQKPNFNTFVPPLEKILGKSPTGPPLEKILPTPMVET